jgi:cystathionine beta-lyase
MEFDFLDSAPREMTNAYKYTLRNTLFKTQDVIPLWIADMDIDTPYFILDAIKERLNHPIFGYESFPKSAFIAQQKWIHSRYDFNFDIDEVFYSPSVVATMGMVIEAFSNIGDKIIVQTPVYPPFFKSVLDYKRELIVNPLTFDKERGYVFDLDDLKSKIDDRVKLLFLCSPHNPVGRCWRRDELIELLEICLKNNIIVFSDEIHADLVYEPNQHIPFASLDKRAKDITITAFGPGKSFNMAGFSTSSIVITNKNLRESFLNVYNKRHFSDGVTLSHVAFESAYINGEVWLKELKEHLLGNYKMLKEVCNAYNDKIYLVKVEATYLAWLDCHGMGMSNKQLRNFFINEARLGLASGLSFSKEGSGFMRLNFALSRKMMQEVVRRLSKALEDRYDKN